VAMATSLKKSPLPSRTAAPSAAATAILDVAERLAQTRGYNGFSYADVAIQLGVTKASLHYHFPSKAELGRALIERYHVLFGKALDAIDQQTNNPHEKLRQYVGLYNSVMSNERMCLCGMLAAEYATLPAPMQRGLTLFFDANERWLTAVLEDGLRTKAFLFREPANERARVVLGALEGAMLVARSYGDPHRFQIAAGCVLADLSASSDARQHRTSARAAARRPRPK
jgi:TetR/AcrR family transcriptional regulator, transcriptional repressor for nem operon